MKRPAGFLNRLMISLVTFYRKFLSPLFPSSCIYRPTCIEYAEQAFRRFGFLRGMWLSLRRVLRCNPFRKGGYDPVRDRWENRK